MSAPIDPMVTWSQQAALTLVREAIQGDIDAARIFEIASEPEERNTVTNVILVTSVLITHLSTLLTMAGSGPDGALRLVDQMLDTNRSAGQS